jgi:hypothetical protein
VCGEQELDGVVVVNWNVSKRLFYNAESLLMPINEKIINVIEN